MSAFEPSLKTGCTLVGPTRFATCVDPAYNRRHVGSAPRPPATTHWRLYAPVDDLTPGPRLPQSFLVIVLLTIGLSAGDRPLPKPNYDLASRWMATKVGKLVFDTSVAPRWAETSDRFWYAFETAQGRRFMLVDPLKRTKAPLWDNAKMAAMLTNITRIPYESQHLPITPATMKWVKNDAAIRFELEVPKDAKIVGEKEEAKKQEASSKKEEVAGQKTEEKKTDEKKTEEKKIEERRSSEEDGGEEVRREDRRRRKWTTRSRREEDRCGR